METKDIHFINVLDTLVDLMADWDENASREYWRDQFAQYKTSTSNVVTIMENLGVKDAKGRYDWITAKGSAFLDAGEIKHLIHTPLYIGHCDKCRHPIAVGEIQHESPNLKGYKNTGVHTYGELEGKVFDGHLCNRCHTFFIEFVDMMVEGGWS